MAIVKYGITVVGVRGTVGGGVFSANKSGPYMKAWQYPIVPRTAAVVEQRARTADLPSAWRALTQAVRDAWDALAANAAYFRTNSLGETYELSGYQLYTSWQRKRQTASLGLFTIAPTATIPTPPPDMAIAADVSDDEMTLDVAAGTYTGDVNGWVEAQPIRSAVSATFPNRWRFLRIFAVTPPATVQLLPLWEPIYGPIQAGQAFAVRLSRWDREGPTSTYLQAAAVVTA